MQESVVRELPTADRDAVESNARTLLAITERYDLTEESIRVSDRLRDVSLGLIVLVTGEGNFGKSSLINAVAGKTIAPVSIVPRTYKVDVFIEPPNDVEFATVRRTSVPDIERVTIDEARSISDAEEAAMSEARRRGEPAHSSLLEIAWHRTGLALGPDICLTDTPGLAQMLSGERPISESLVKGLGATYYVDEVWSLWYHRADVVLWCFQANQLESAETHRTLTLLTEKYQKSVIPVATKCDLIPQHRWPEIQHRFHAIYAPLLGDSQAFPLFLTVTSEKSELNGHGISELRSCLQSLAPAAKARKLAATEQFTVDGARHLESILQSGGTHLVDNLRTIADTVDEIALEAMRQTRAAVEVNRDLAEKHAHERQQALNDFLLPLSERVQEMEDGGSSPSTMKWTVESELSQFLQLNVLSEKLRATLDAVGKDVEAFSVTICSTRQLHRVSISVAGRESTEAFQLQLDVPLSSLSLRLALDAPNFSDPGWLKAFDGWGEFGQKVGRFLKGFFGMKAGARVRRMSTGINQELSQKVKEAEELCQDYLSDHVAAALNRSLTEVFEKVTGTTTKALFSSLEALDEDMYKLQTLRRSGDPARTKFELWARYWTAVSPAVEVVRKLVSDMVLPRLDAVRSHIRSFQHLHTLRIEEISTFVRDETKNRVSRDALRASLPLRKFFSRVLGLGLAECRIERSFSTDAALRHITGPIRQIDGKLTTLSIEETVCEEFESWLQSDKITASVDDEAGERIPNASFSGFAGVFRSRLASLFELELAKQVDSSESGTAVAAVPCYAVGPLFMSRRLAPVIVALLFAIGFLYDGAILGVALSATAFVFSPLVLKIEQRGATHLRMRQIVAEAAREAARLASESVTVSFVEDVVEDVAVELSPRPLQRALNRMME